MERSVPTGVIRERCCLMEPEAQALWDSFIRQTIGATTIPQPTVIMLTGMRLSLRIHLQLPGIEFVVGKGGASLGAESGGVRCGGMLGAARDGREREREKEG